MHIPPWLALINWVCMEEYTGIYVRIYEVFWLPLWEKTWSMYMYDDTFGEVPELPTATLRDAGSIPACDVVGCEKKITY